MPELLFDPVEIHRYNLTQLYRIIEGMSPEEVEKYLVDNQISQVLALAVRAGIEPEELTAEIKKILKLQAEQIILIQLFALPQ